jgi:hypothetical protein
MTTNLEAVETLKRDTDVHETTHGFLKIQDLCQLF